MKFLIDTLYDTVLNVPGLGASTQICSCHHQGYYFFSDRENYEIPVADPGFPVAGRRPRRGGALTSEAVTFRKFCMSK